jgi:hypothetical protein
MVKKMVGVAALSLAGIIGTALPAYADNFPPDTRSTTGASATCTMSTRDGRVHDQFADIDCNIRDTLADRKSVYVEWWQDGFGKVRLSNNAGSGQTVRRRDSRFNPSGSFEHLYWRVCRDIPLFPDNCSGTVRHDPR